MSNNESDFIPAAYPINRDSAKGKSVHSRDPRKPAIVAALKKASNCRKVTTVCETSAGFTGNCIWGSGVTPEGFWFVPARDCLLP